MDGLQLFSQFLFSVLSQTEIDALNLSEQNEIEVSHKNFVD